MNTRNFLALAAFGGLLVAAGCSGKKDNAADSAGTSAMTDTAGMGTVGTSGSMGGTMTDSTGATTGTITDSAAVPTTGDTTTRR